MVNINSNNNDYYRSGGGYSRLPWEPVERPAADHSVNDGDRLAPVTTRTALPSVVGGALRDQCSINWRSFFIAVILDNGEHVYLTGPEILSREEGRQLFDMERFLQCQGQSSRDISRQGSIYPNDEMYYQDAEMDHQFYRRQQYAGAPYRDHADARMPRGRKRQRASGGRGAVDHNEVVPVPTVKKGLRIGDSPAVWHYYLESFKGLQQLACKIIGKAFVKAVAPKKQSNHPYTGKEDTAPRWWPKAWGPSEHQKVRHTEPDHLLKNERIHLCAHILRLVVEPLDRQHEDIRKVGMTVSKLETLTMDAMSPFFSDSQNPRNATKKGLLKEIFKVAREEERMKKGYIDPCTVVFVSTNSGSGRGTDDDDDEAGGGRITSAQIGGAGQDEGDLSSGASSRMSPARTPSTFMSDMTPRPASHYGEAMDLDSRHPYTLPAVGQLPTINTIQLDDLITSPSDAARRSSLYASPPSAAEFPSAAAAATVGSHVYSSPAAWPGAAASAATPASTNPAMYAFTSTPQAASSPFAASHSQQQHSYMGSYTSAGYTSSSGSPPGYSSTPGNGVRFNSAGGNGVVKPERLSSGRD